MFKRISREKKRLFARILVALAVVGVAFAVGFFVNGSLYGELAARDATAIRPGLEPDEQKRAYELYKLEQEVESLRVSNEALSRTDKWLTAWLTAIGGSVIALLIPAVGYFLNRTQNQKLEQDKKLGREEQLLKVFNDLGDDKPTIRIGAIAILVQRIRPLADLGEDASDEEKEELRTIVSVLISASKHEREESIQKYIADGLADGLNALLDKGQTGTLRPLGRESAFKEYDFQGAQLQNAWWYSIDARGVDLYKANLQRAGLRKAVLRGAVLKHSDLSEATLSEANLSNLTPDKPTDLQRAKLVKAKLIQTDLSGAKLQEANLERANLEGANLTEADLQRADLTGAKLTGAIFHKTKLAGAKICRDAFALAIKTDINETGIIWTPEPPPKPATASAAATTTPPAGSSPKLISHTIDFGKQPQVVRLVIESGDAAADGDKK